MLMSQTASMTSTTRPVDDVKVSGAVLARGIPSVRPSVR